MLAILAVFLFSAFGFLFARSYSARQYPSGIAMMELIEDQLVLGPRYVGSDGHSRVRSLIRNNLAEDGVLIQDQIWTDVSGQQLQNIIGRINPEAKRRVIVATHYDTKRDADRDVSSPQAPVPGANDGASGVAVLLNLSRSVANSPGLKDIGVDLVFFDGEELDPGPFSDWHPKGSSYFASHIMELYPTENPEFAIVPDMVCKKDLRLLKERGSVQNASDLTNQLWDIGRSVDRAIFVDKEMNEVKDDHTPLNAIGIPSVVLIDLNYPAFHTTQDTLDKCSPKTLETVHQTIKKFLADYDRNL